MFTERMVRVGPLTTFLLSIWHELDTFLSTIPLAGMLSKTMEGCSVGGILVDCKVWWSMLLTRRVQGDVAERSRVTVPRPGS